MLLARHSIVHSFGRPLESCPIGTTLLLYLFFRSASPPLFRARSLFAIYHPLPWHPISSCVLGEHWVTLYGSQLIPYLKVFPRKWPQYWHVQAHYAASCNLMSTEIFLIKCSVFSFKRQCFQIRPGNIRFPVTLLWPMLKSLLLSLDGQIQLGSRWMISARERNLLMMPLRGKAMRSSLCDLCGNSLNKQH